MLAYSQWMRSYAVRFLGTLTELMMLLPKDIHPKESLYYNGGFIIDALKRFDEIELMDLFYETKKKLRYLYQFLFYLLTGYT